MHLRLRHQQQPHCIHLNAKPLFPPLPRGRTGNEPTLQRKLVNCLVNAFLTSRSYLAPRGQPDPVVSTCPWGVDSPAQLEIEARGNRCRPSSNHWQPRGLEDDYQSVGPLFALPFPSVLTLDQRRRNCQPKGRFHSSNCYCLDHGQRYYGTHHRHNLHRQD